MNKLLGKPEKICCYERGALCSGAVEHEEEENRAVSITVTPE
jgi:hypothetical protein